MTTDSIRDRVAHIMSIAGDDEAAHGCEDDLRKDFIEHVATSTVEPYAEMARLVLSTEAIEFERWCA